MVSSTLAACQKYWCRTSYSAVSGPDRCDPDINTTYLEMAKHYGVALVPARPAKPRDKQPGQFGGEDGIRTRV